MKTQTRSEWLIEGVEERKKTQKNEKLQAEFDATDKKNIKKLNDAELARWQAKYPSGSPQTIFADQLWKYRLAKHSAKFTALIAIISAIVGGVVGYSLRGPQNEKPPASQEVSKQSKVPATYVK